MCWLPVVRDSHASDLPSGSFSDNLHLGSDQILIKVISNLRWMLEQKSDMEEVEMMRHHLVHHVNDHGHHLVHRVKDFGHHLVVTLHISLGNQRSVHISCHLSEGGRHRQINLSK